MFCSKYDLLWYRFYIALHKCRDIPGDPSAAPKVNMTLLGYFRRGGATGKAFGLAISRSRVQILLETTLRNNLGQVVHTYVPLSPSSITW